MPQKKNDASTSKRPKPENQVNTIQPKAAQAMSAKPDDVSATPEIAAKAFDKKTTAASEESAETSGARPVARDQAPEPASSDTFTDARDDVLGVINELEEQLDRYEDMREHLERELSQSQEQGRAAKQRIQELEWQSVTLQTRVEALEHARQEVSLLEEEIRDANACSQRLTDQIARDEKEKKRLGGDLKAANKQLEELWAVRKERDGLRADIKSTISKLDQIERAHRELQEDRNNLQSKQQETQIALDETRAAKHELEMDLRSAESRCEELRGGGEDVKARLDTMRAEKKNLQVQLTHVERENTRLIEQQQYHERELNSLRGANRTAEAALANVKKAFAEVRVALAETKTRARRRSSDSRPRTSYRPLEAVTPAIADPDTEAIRAIADVMPGEPAEATPSEE